MSTENSFTYLNHFNPSSSSPHDVYGSSAGAAEFHFLSMTGFDAYRDFLQRRHHLHKLPPQVLDHDIWKRQPPDFRYQAFEPKPPKRNTRDAVKPWKYANSLDGYYKKKLLERKEQILSPVTAMRNTGKGDHEDNLSAFHTGFRVIRPGTAKRLFAAQGMNKAGLYESPKQHDFRGLPPIKSLGLPEFETAIKKDPYNIEFLLANRRTITGPLHEIQNLRDVSGTLNGNVEKPSKWDPRLHLPRDPWPAKVAEYTRYRCHNQDPYEGFMTRVEEALDKKWRLEKCTATSGITSASATF